MFNPKLRKILLSVRGKPTTVFCAAAVAVALVSCAPPPRKLSFAGDQSAADGTRNDGSSNDSTAADSSVKSSSSSTANLEDPNVVFEAIMNQVEKGPCAQVASSKSSTRIITDEEWVDAVNSAFGISLDKASMLAMLPRSTISSSVAFRDYDHLREDNSMSVEKLESFSNANAQAATEIVKAKGDQILNCGGNAKDCVGTWLTKTLPTLWRKSITAADVSPLTDLFDKAGSTKPALERVIQRVLLSHQFLFRSALGTDGQLNSWEVADALADVLWASSVTPDLAKIADAGGLKNKADIEKQIAQMIADPKFYNGLRRFVKAWLRTDGVKNLSFADSQKISAATQNDLVDESTNYLYHLVRTNSDTFENIFKSKFTVGSDNLASTYGFTKSGTATSTPNASNLNTLTFPDGRYGLVSQPGFLASVSSLTETKPPKRGREVMAIFMCQSRVTPQNLLDAVAKVGGSFDKNKSVVDNFKAVTTGNAVCEGCHVTLNGIGFGMEDVSATGVMRTMDDYGKAVVADGNLVTITGKKIPYKGIAGLNDALSQSKDAEACMTLQVFRMVNSRRETSNDACLISSAFKRAAGNNFKLTEVFTALLTDSGFLTRKKGGQ